MAPSDDANADQKRNDSEFEVKLERSIIAIPLLEMMKQEPAGAFRVILDLNYHYPGGTKQAKRKVRKIVDHLRTEQAPAAEAIAAELGSDERSQQYLFGRFHASVIRALARIDRDGELDDDLWERVSEASPKNISRTAFAVPAIHRIWPDFKVKAHLDRSIRTVKCDAAHAAFGAFGEGIVWAVMDSGIDERHVHFRRHANLTNLPEALDHRDFTEGDAPLADESGHGTHVAGIIAGEAQGTADEPVFAVRQERDPMGEEVSYARAPLTHVKGVAPESKLLSLKVLDGKDEGHASSLIAALDYIQKVNGHGRHIHIHGVNMSVGYEFDPEWFACGQSPLCREVDRLVRSGVVVVTAAGNTGYGYVDSKMMGVVTSGLALTINDPGNAELAITVGATHRDAPYRFGVSYFSSKGPTGDGRLKPDLVAPGERILSCASQSWQETLEAKLDGPAKLPIHYREASGTSMAAPHVSGLIAAFLSIRKEFQGRPERVKEIFLNSATDLRRERYFQGSGLVDQMRAIQSV